MSDCSGYHSCPCRDCFEIAIGEDDDGNPALCHACEDAGCSADSDVECLDEHAYGRDCSEPKCCAPPDESVATPAPSTTEIKWVVYSGRPSWHQMKAGHAFAGSMVFTGEDAEDRARKYAACCKEHRPDEPQVIVKETITERK